ncbi:MAG: hypothetical protein Kow0098_04830 [Ignavibacteriaceae bacterium]
MKNKSILFYLPPLQFYEEQYLIISRKLKTEGFQIFITSGTSACCSGVNGLRVQPDMKLFNVNPNNFDAFLITGGNLLFQEGYWERILRTIRTFANSGKVIAAIFNGSELLYSSGLLTNNQNSDTLRADKPLTGKTAQKILIRENMVICYDSSLSGEFADTIIELSQYKKR